MKNNKKSEFISYVTTYHGSYTDFTSIRLWIESTPRLKNCATVDELKQAMGKDSYFEKRHFKKLDAAVKFYFANKDLFV